MSKLAKSFREFIQRVKVLRPSATMRRIAAHNRRVFSLAPENARSEPVVLFELNKLRSAHIAYSYLANTLAEENNARIVAYMPRFAQGWRHYFYVKIKQMLEVDEFAVYKSFGTTEFLIFSANVSQKTRAKSFFDSVTPLLKNCRDIENLEIDGTRVGDLIYDSYLARYRRPTIDIASEEFRGFLLESVELFLCWTDYFDSHDVRAVNVSHCVYNLAMPLRIAVKRGIPAYQAHMTHVYRLSGRNFFAYNDFAEFPALFRALPPQFRAAGLAEAERRVKRRFAGEVGVDMEYSTKSAYSKPKHAQLLRPSSHKKILIATHCFFDSPHGYGDNIFPDFNEWLTFLGEMTKSTEYDWYIKTHPDYLPGTKEVIDRLVVKYPRLTLLPADASHHQIVAEGIDLALTVHGTIAFEYAALGVPVINASQNNPHIAYDFNLHARDVEDYRRMLLNLESLNLKIDREKVYEYYFMKFICNTDDIFFESYSKAVNDLGGYSRQFEPAVYDRWPQEWSPARHEAIRDALSKFVRSGDFRMNYTHFGKEYTFNALDHKA